MTRDLDLNSKRWLALVFADKNQDYGAYVHRVESSDRHLKAMIIISVIALSLIFLPKIVKSIMPAEKDIGQITSVNISNIDLEQQVPEENQIKQIEVPPPPELKTTVAFTPPVITKDEDIADEQLLMTQQDLTDVKADISIMTVEGSETGTVDIADLAEHKIITQEPEKPQIFNFVESPPQFPGGEAALFRWLRDNIVYPTIATEQGIQGVVNLRFVVTPDGSVEDVQVTKSLDPSCDREAIRAVKKMPKWVPGRQNGNPVYVYFNLPVRFRLETSQ